MLENIAVLAYSSEAVSGYAAASGATPYACSLGSAGIAGGVTGTGGNNSVQHSIDVVNASLQRQ